MVLTAHPARPGSQNIRPITPDTTGPGIGLSNSQDQGGAGAARRVEPQADMPSGAQLAKSITGRLSGGGSNDFRKTTSTMNFADQHSEEAESASAKEETTPKKEIGDTANMHTAQCTPTRIADNVIALIRSAKPELQQREETELNLQMPMACVALRHNQFGARRQMMIGDVFIGLEPISGYEHLFTQNARQTA